MNGVGVDNYRTLRELSITTGVVKKGGAWYTWADPTSGQEYKGQGLEGFRKLLPEDWLNSMFNQVRVYLTSKKVEEEPVAKNPKDSMSDDAKGAMSELDDLFGS